MKVNVQHSSNLNLPTNYPLHGFVGNAPNNGDLSSTWVHLLESPSPFAYQEALLLCQHSENEWVAWIPDCGEKVLHVSEFCTNY